MSIPNPIDRFYERLATDVEYQRLMRLVHSYLTPEQRENSSALLRRTHQLATDSIVEFVELLHQVGP